MPRRMGHGPSQAARHSASVTPSSTSGSMTTWKTTGSTRIFTAHSGSLDIKACTDDRTARSVQHGSQESYSCCVLSRSPEPKYAIVLAKALLVAASICIVGFLLTALTSNLVALYVTVPIALVVFAFMLARPYVRSGASFRDERLAP